MVRFCSFSHRWPGGACKEGRVQRFVSLTPFSGLRSTTFGANVVSWRQRHMTVRRWANVLSGGARNRALRRDREAICDVTGPRMNGLQTKGIQTEKVKRSWLRRAATETHENGCVTADRFMAPKTAQVGSLLCGG